MADDSLPAHGIYAIRNTANGRVYVGSAVNLRRRLRIHRWHLDRGDHHSIKLQRAWRKHGFAAFAFEIVEEVRETSALLEREQHYIDGMNAFGRGYNMAPRAGSPMLGVKHSDEAKRKISAAFKSVPKKTPLVKKGQKLPPEWIANAAEGQRGRKLSSQTKALISARAKGNTKWLGRKHSPESIEKMKAAHQARWAALRLP